MTEVGISERRINAIIDTGSQVSLISKEYYLEHLQNNHSIQNAPQAFKMTAANGTNIPYYGFVVTDIAIEGQIIKDMIIFIVSRSSIDTPPLLLGMNVLQHLPQFGNLLSRRTPENLKLCAKVGKNVPLLPGYTTMEIIASGLNPSDTRDFLFEPSEKINLPEGLIIPTVLIQPTNGQITLTVLNLTQNTITLKPKQARVLSPRA